jgi:hypothetical protein
MEILKLFYNNIYTIMPVLITIMPVLIIFTIMSVLALEIFDIALN